MIDAAEGLGDGGGVGNHAHGALDPGKVSSGNDGGRLVIDTALEPCRTVLGKGVNDQGVSERVLIVQSSIHDYKTISRFASIISHHQSTNWMVLFVLMVATAALTSLGTTSPRYIRQHAMYFP